MKSKEELKNIREKYEATSRDLASLDKKERKNKADALDATLRELSEDELKEVAAGSAIMMSTHAFSVFIHNNCGGEILNVGNPFFSCVCSKCGETHYWHYSFDYTETHTNQ